MSFYSGYISDEEYLQELESASDRVTDYDKMRRSDGTCNAMGLAIKLPIVNATWDVECEDDKIREIIYNGLFNDMSQPWRRTLKEILTMLDFGWSMQEIVWEIRDGLIMPRKLAFRNQKSFKNWYRPKKKLIGVTQEIYGDDAETTEHTIPIEKMIIHTHEQEGDNYQGKSIFRSARKHYKMKLIAEKAGIIGIQRYLVGMLSIECFDMKAPNWSEDVREKVEETLKNWAMHGRNYAIPPQGHRFSIVTPQGTFSKEMFETTVNYHKNEMISSILADFLLLGKTAVGSRALSDPQMMFFLNAVNSVAHNIAENLNRYLIKKWVDYNWNLKEYPRVTVSGIESTDLRQLSEIFKNLFDAGALRKDTKLYEFIRESFGLPEEDTKEIEEQEKQKQEFIKNIKPAPDKEEDKEEGAKAGEVVRWREPTELERNTLNLDEIQTGLINYEKKLVDVVNNWQEKQKRQLARDVARKPLDKIHTLKVRMTNDMYNDIKPLLIDVYKFGRKQVKQELKKTLAKTKKLQDSGWKIITEEDALDAIDNSANILTNDLSDRLKKSAIAQANRMMGFEPKDIEEGVNKHLNDLSKGITAGFIIKAINGSFGKGRQVEAYATEGVKKATGSSLYDACIACGTEIDGHEWVLGNEPQLPYMGCKGFDYCRCMMVYS